LQNHDKGSIRCLNFDPNRNYLFAASYDDGEISVFEMDKPGREKYAKMTAFMKGK
jgi:6-phosphogluconolactonase (cycloisomerase 2 family)